MKKQPQTKPQSRRQVQRRFPPGAFVVSRETCSIIGTIVGWSAVRATYYPYNGTKSQTWEVLILTNKNVLSRENWMSMEDKMSFEEWEDWYTSP